MINLRGQNGCDSKFPTHALISTLRIALTGEIKAMREDPDFDDYGDIQWLRGAIIHEVNKLCDEMSGHTHEDRYEILRQCAVGESMLHQGNGAHSLYRWSVLLDAIEYAVIILSDLQQIGLQGTEYEHYTVAVGARTIEDIVRRLAMALTGKTITFEEKRP
jgi:hypothetical protein